MKRFVCVVLPLWFLCFATGLVGVPASAEAQFYGGVPDYQANLNTCLRGSYAALCNHGVLSAEDAQRVRAAEYQANLNTCLRGSYAALCNHGVLSAEEAQRVNAAEIAANTISSRGQPTQSLNAPTLSPTSPLCAENGSCYGDTSALTGRPKTVPVEGYYRKDGTYVRGHYRSKPR